ESVALGRELHTVWDAMAAFPEAASYVALRRGRPVEWPALRSLLAEEGSRPESGGQRLVTAHYYCTPGQTLLFVGRADLEQPEVVRIPLDHGQLSRFVRMHFGRTRRVREMLEDGHEPEWQAFSSLVEPLSRWSQRGDVLYLIPHGLLHHLPLHTLTLEGVPLAERNRVVYSPSASALHVCLNRHRRWEPRGQTRPRAAVFGDSRGASPAERLPRSREEARALEQQLGVSPLLGEAVTREAFSRAAETAELIHFAGHGDLAAEDGLESGLRLAAGDVLRAREVFSLRMNPDLVTLSGCETGVSEFRSGDELLGLPAAFLYAGAESLLASQWRVDDASTAFLMREFYARAFGTPALPKAEALRQAMQVTRQQPEWGDFYHWGAFTLVGDWK
ncbi:CHAT domain-containing protein, partial [Pyxidicoccus sp. 3LG]